MGDHTECIQIDYDADLTSYAQLVDTFFSLHQPFYDPGSVQYRSIAFYQNEEERVILENAVQQIEAAETSSKAHVSFGSAKVKTQIRPFPQNGFYLAEDYHQKYYLQKYPEFVEYLIRQKGSFAAFRDSTEAARLSALIAGMGSRQELDALLPELGLTEKLESLLRRIHARYHPI